MVGQTGMERENGDTPPPCKPIATHCVHIQAVTQCVNSKMSTSSMSEKPILLTQQGRYSMLRASRTIVDNLPLTNNPIFFL